MGELVVCVRELMATPLSLSRLSAGAAVNDGRLARRLLGLKYRARAMSVLTCRRAPSANDDVMVVTMVMMLFANSLPPLASRLPARWLAGWLACWLA